jgi:uncharacterized protein (TIGR03437 family)
MEFLESAELLFELGDAGVEFGDGLALGVGELAMLEHVGGFVAGADDFAGDADDGGVVGDGMDDNAAGADANAVADFDVAEDFGAGADDHAVAESRVAFAAFLAGAAEGDALIEQAVVTDFGSLADDDAHAVIDEETAADAGAGVDLDACEEPAGLGDDAGQQGDAGAVKLVGEAVQEDGVEAGIAEHDFQAALGGGILAEDGVELFADGPEHDSTHYAMPQGAGRIRNSRRQVVLERSRKPTRPFPRLHPQIRTVRAGNGTHGHIKQKSAQMFRVAEEAIMKNFKLFVLATMAMTVAFAAPRLRLSETTIGPVSVAQGTNGPTRSVEYFNAGDGTLSVTLSSSASWAVATAGAGRQCSVFAGTGICTPVNVALNTSSLAAGTHTAVVTLRDPNAVDAPQTVTVTVIVGGAVPASANLFVSTAAGSRDSVAFTTNSLVQGTPATTTGGNWLSLAFEGSGSFAFVLPYAIRAVNPGGLAEGTYNGTMRIANSALAVDNKTVNVTMRVTSQPIAAASQSEVRLRAAQGAPTQVANIVMNNRGLGTLALQAPAVTMTSGQGWLTAAQIAGTQIVQVRTSVGSLSPGTYTGSVAIPSNAANGTQTIPVTFEVIARGAPFAAPGGVVNNATFAREDQLGRGTIAAVFGEQFLFTDPVAATSLPLQQTLGGVRVLVNGAAAPVYFVSYGQINFQIPFDAAEGLATVVVESGGQRSNPVAVPIANRAPRVLRLGIGDYGILVNQDGTFPLPASAGLGSAARPARAGDTLVIYAIGLGPTNPVVASGAAAPSSPLARVEPTPSVIIGSTSISQNEAITPLFVGLTPGFVGLYQINVTLPVSVERGNEVPMFLNMGENVFSNRVTLAIQ